MTGLSSGLTLLAAEEEGSGLETTINWTTVGLWAATAAGGFLILAIYLKHGGRRDTPYASGLPRIGLPRIGVHLLLGAAGLVLWIIYAITDLSWTAWAALGLLVVAIAIGGSMLFIKDQQRVALLRRSGALNGAAGPATLPPEQQYPMWLHAGHGGLATATLLLVLLNRAGAFG